MAVNDPNLFPDLPEHRLFFGKSDIDREFTDSFERDLIATEAFQRLRTISFLGAIDYLYQPNQYNSWRRHTRYHHSLGVAKLAKHYAVRMQIERANSRVIFAAAAMHDIGHAPLSHTLEPIFRRLFGVDHHKSSLEIIIGNHRLGVGVNSVFKKYRIDRDEVIALLNGGEKSVFKSLFSSPLNLDTLEAISRSYSYLNKNHVFPSPALIVDHLVDGVSSGVRRFDDFWRLKNIVYRFVINSPFGAMADNLAREWAEAHLGELSIKDIYLDELAFKRRHRSLFRVLAQARMGFYAERKAVSATDMSVVPRRDFVVDDSVWLYRDSDLSSRYTQSKALGRAPGALMPAALPNQQQSALDIINNSSARLAQNASRNFNRAAIRKSKAKKY